jgi:molybdate transport system ATP-binding protein
MIMRLGAKFENYFLARPLTPAAGHRVADSVCDERSAEDDQDTRTAELVADFEKQFPGGPLIRFRLRRSEGSFSLTVLFGPSGSGKTTALRCLAGLERPDRGYIRFGNEIWFDAERRIFVPPQQRRIGYLFQDYTLFPHLTVARNIGYGLRTIDRAERLHRVAEIMQLLGLTGLAGRYPDQISGGQQQRVALARAVVCRPRMLLLDEPLSALDVPTRVQVRRQLRRSLEKLRMPGFLVTHDRVDALALGDHMVILEDGRVCQSGPVQEVFSRPADLSVARIVGIDTVERAKIVHVSDGLATIQIGSAKLFALASDDVNEDAYVCIHAEDVVLEQIGSTPRSSARNRLIGRIRSLDREGPMMRVLLDCGFPLRALVTKQAYEEMQLHEGDEVVAVLKAGALHLVSRGEFEIPDPRAA